VPKKAVVAAKVAAAIPGIREKIAACFLRLLALERGSPLYRLPLLLSVRGYPLFSLPLS